jgi:hypothetical protein
MSHLTSRFNCIDPLRGPCESSTVPASQPHRRSQGQGIVGLGGGGRVVSCRVAGCTKRLDVALTCTRRSKGQQRFRALFPPLASYPAEHFQSSTVMLAWSMAPMSSCMGSCASPCMHGHLAQYKYNPGSTSDPFHKQIRYLNPAHFTSQVSGPDTRRARAVPVVLVELEPS